MTIQEKKIEELRKQLREEPAHWLGYDDETRELLKQKSVDAKPREFIGDVAGCPTTME